MFYEDKLGIWVILIVQGLTSYKCNDPYENPRVKRNFAEFHCFKLRTCTPGGGKVCGFDEYAVKVAEFEDICTMHKVNCDGIGSKNNETFTKFISILTFSQLLSVPLLGSSPLTMWGVG